ncbi:MAG: GatB/YqeY domain-containing protein [Nitrospirota bacterium]
MNLRDKLLSEMKEAMKSGDADRLSVIRMVRATIKNKEIEKGKDYLLNEEEIVQVLATAVKQRKESITLFQEGDRPDLVEKEQKEVMILESYLPPALSDTELAKLVSEAIATSGAQNIKQMGEVMKILLPEVTGRADGKKVSDLVRSVLGS